MPYEILFCQARNIVTQNKFAELLEDVTKGLEKEIVKN